MNRLKILSVFGTRPEAIKMAPIVKKLAQQPERVQSYVCVTAQHREMLDQVLTLFDIQPDYDLNLMAHNQTPTQVAARVMSTLEPLLAELKPDWMLVQGDTTTVMAAAIAAHYQQVRVGHVEAGLRTYDRQNPFPEEMNRVVADHVSDLCFAPTAASRDNLRREGIADAKIFVTGNSVIDALLETAARPIPPSLYEWAEAQGLSLFFQNNPSTDRTLITVTAHRRENHGQPIRHICQAIRHLAQTRPELQFVYPVHRNPNIWNPVHELLQGLVNVTLTPPVDYLTLVHLMKRSKLVLTDSGGIQEEAPSLGAPVLVLRETTERPEAVAAGAARVVGTDPQRIVQETMLLLDDTAVYQQMSRAVNPYGDGQASARITQLLLEGACDEFQSPPLT
ncbi:MAG: UDP-N-acetylglucosamine 2-epimerase (non-hydrolyzing) [Anaerolinea sp.]|nr:UDP-N-acetylglucosamine 2-epimerase (non-hydrolyzing) [Anaerolinea sp.]